MSRTFQVEGEWKQRLCGWHQMTEYGMLRVISHPYTSHLWLQGKAFSNVLKDFFLNAFEAKMFVSKMIINEVNSSKKNNFS